MQSHLPPVFQRMSKANHRMDFGQSKLSNLCKVHIEAPHSDLILVEDWPTAQKNIFQSASSWCTVSDMSQS